ncbi:hypothetical protein [Cellulophaga baltica]|uniref:hypothetical protein n=1 Tax=Cellulophaga baltica TaxID=76594 RepID=UPI00249546D9|nr:hypothetical protein [Cellulophaga baltica]
MKNTILLFICLINIVRAQEHKREQGIAQVENINVVPKEKQITYAIHINAKTPYEIYLDDIPIERNYESGMNSTIELNQYLLKNGKHKLKVRYLPRPDSVDGLLQPNHVYNSKDSKWNIYFLNYVKNKEKPLGYEGELDYQNNELLIVAPPEPVLFWEQTFELNVDALPYELEGWSNGQNLEDLNKDELKKEVFKEYNKIRDLLNLGKVDEYISINKKKYLEMAVCLYTKDVNTYWSESVKKELISDCKGNMWPLSEEEYTMKIYGNGKLVKLERINQFKNRGLIAETETDYWYYSFLLYKTIGSDTFEIIRK